MAEPQQSRSQPPSPSPSQQQKHQKDEMMACVLALEAALLPCLPARELQAVDRSVHSSHQIDVERHARDFMEAAKKLQLYFIGLQHEDQPTKEEMLRKEISIIEEELKTKSELILKYETLIQVWRKELEDQMDTHITELERGLITENRKWKNGSYASFRFSKILMHQGGVRKYEKLHAEE